MAVLKQKQPDGTWAVVGSSSGGEDNSVKYVPQQLNEEQKAQARENIGADTIDILNDNAANALKNYIQGKNLVSIEDISPIQHNISVKLIQTNLANLNYAQPLKEEKITIEGNKIKFQTTREDKVAYGIAFPQKYLNLEIGKTYSFSFKSISKYSSGMYGWSIRFADGTRLPEKSPYISNSNVYKNVLITKEVQQVNIYTSVVSDTSGQEITIENIQIEENNTNTTFVAHVDPTSLSVSRYGSDESDNFATYYADKYDIVKVPSLYPVTTLLSNNSVVSNMNIQYSQDTEKILDGYKQDLDKKLTINSSEGTARVYGIDRFGAQRLYNVADTESVWSNDGRIAMFLKNTSGNIEPSGVLLTHTPTLPYQAANKKYVDELVGKVSGGGGANVVISNSEPEDAEDGTLWFDTSETTISYAEGVGF